MFKKILVPLDLSAMAEAALPLARNLAECYGASLVVLYVHTPPQLQYYGPEMDATMMQVDEITTAEAMAHLHRIVANLRDRGLNATAATLTEVSAADGILNYADHNSIDLIAMSTHGRTGFGRWLLGSVADKVIHGAKMPVLLVRPAEAKAANIW